MESFVRGLIDDILEAVSNPLLHKGLEQLFHQPKTPTVTAKSPTARRLIPLLPKLCHHRHDEVSPAFPSVEAEAEVEVAVEVAQVRVIQQRFNGSCGYYALYNVLTTIEALTSEDEERTHQHLRYLDHNPRFWHMYHTLEKMLLEKAKFEGNRAYPWNTSSINTGIMERNYISYFLHSARARALNEAVAEPLDGDHGYPPTTPSLTVLSDFGLQTLKYNCLPLFNAQRLHRAVRSVLDGTQSSHAFLVGVTNHWVGVILTRTSEKSFEILLLDSRNKPLLGKDDEELWGIADELLAESAARKKYFPSNNSAYALYLSQEERRRLIHDSLKGCQLFVRILSAALTKKRDIFGSLFDINLDGFFENYEREVEIVQKETQFLDDESFFPRFQSWMQDYMPPPVFEQNFIRVIRALAEFDQQRDQKVPGIFDSRAKTRLRFWTQRLLRRTIVINSEHPAIHRFLQSLQWLHARLSTDSFDATSTATAV